MTFKRFYIPAVQLEIGGAIISNLDSQGLRIEWEIERDNTNKADEGTVTIYNLAPALINGIFEAWQQLSQTSAGFFAIFSLGWDRVPQICFTGEVWDLIPERRTPTDRLSVFRLGDGNRPLRDGVVAQTFKQVQIGTVLEYLVSLPPASVDAGGGGLGLLYPAESKALVETAAGELPMQTFGNIPAGSNTRDAIDLIMDTLGLEWRVHNRSFVAMRGGIINRPGPILRPGTGLISYEKRNDGGIVVSALANPDVEPGIQIQVQDNLGRAFGEPVYRVTRVRFAGNTDGDSIMEIEAAKGRAA